MPPNSAWNAYSKQGEKWYDQMQACLNGHVITAMCLTDPSRMKKRCPKCGAETITNCPSCDSAIQGYEHIPGVHYGGPDTPPAHCHECGESYPWTKANADSRPKRGVGAVTSSIFVVHGHDEEMKQHVARVVAKLGLKPIILHEQPNSGKTIIEKLEHNADVGFAIVLLSPDDMGYLEKDGPTSAKPRARQNVVIELGYFVGRFGRDRVMPLVRGDVEIPGDFSGVVYTEYDSKGAWRFDLVKELKAAHFDVSSDHLLT